MYLLVNYSPHDTGHFTSREHLLSYVSCFSIVFSCVEMLSELRIVVTWDLSYVLIDFQFSLIG